MVRVDIERIRFLLKTKGVEKEGNLTKLEMKIGSGRLTHFVNGQRANRPSSRPPGLSHDVLKRVLNYLKAEGWYDPVAEAWAELVKRLPRRPTPSRREAFAALLAEWGGYYTEISWSKIVSDDGDGNQRTYPVGDGGLTAEDYMAFAPALEDPDYRAGLAEAVVENLLRLRGHHLINAHWAVAELRLREREGENLTEGDFVALADEAASLLVLLIQGVKRQDATT